MIRQVAISLTSSAALAWATPAFSHEDYGFEGATLAAPRVRDAAPHALTSFEGASLARAGAAAGWSDAVSFGARTWPLPGALERGADAAAHDSDRSGADADASGAAGSPAADRLLAQAGAAAANAGGNAAASAKPERGPWVLQVSGLVYHWLDERCKSCDRRTLVPGLGIQRELSDRAQGNSVFALAAGVQTDSFGCVGSYFAATGSMRYRTQDYEVKPGVGAFLFYRTMDTTGRHHWVPAVLPFMSVEDRRSGLGVNLLMAPNFTWGGKLKSGFAFVQVTYRF